MNSLYTSLNFGLGEEVDMLRDAVQDFAKHEIAPIAAKVDNDNAFPNEIWPVLGGMGLLGVTVPEEYGGANMGYLAHVVAMEEISRASASIGLSYGAHSNLCVNQINRNGNAAQKSDWPASRHGGDPCQVPIGTLGWRLQNRTCRAASCTMETDIWCCRA